MNAGPRRPARAFGPRVNEPLSVPRPLQPGHQRKPMPTRPWSTSRSPARSITVRSVITCERAPRKSRLPRQSRRATNPARTASRRLRPGHSPASQSDARTEGDPDSDAIATARAVSQPAGSRELCREQSDAQQSQRCADLVGGDLHLNLLALCAARHGTFERKGLGPIACPSLQLDCDLAQRVAAVERQDAESLRGQQRRAAHR